MFKNAQYVKSVISIKDSPNINKLCEFAFVGRSNIGKSSLINLLTNRKNLAKVSQVPGKTQTINYFLINEEFYLVDLPGYGYTAKSRSISDKFGSYLESYLINNSLLKYVFLLVDFKIGPTQDDLLMLNYLRSLNHDVKIVVTKSDKVTTTNKIKQLNNIKSIINMDTVFITTTTKIDSINELVEFIYNNAKK